MTEHKGFCFLDTRQDQSSPSGLGSLPPMPTCAAYPAEHDGATVPLFREVR
jgi:hypothetical protein